MIKAKSLTNSMRHVCLVDRSTLSMYKSNIKLFLNMKISNKVGRNNEGSITVYTKSSRNKKLYRLIDFNRNIYNIPGIVYTTEYDPYRSSYISLIVYRNNICTYILSINNVCTGDIINTYKTISKYYNKGDCANLLTLPVGSIIHNLEYLPTYGSIYIRSAGTYGKVLRRHTRTNTVLVLLPSKYTFYASIFSKATIGVLSNIHHKSIKLGKAGRSRWLGIKPNVRGVAMNPIDHPHGGGEGKRSADAHKKSPWGKIHKWYNRKIINKLI